MRVMTVLAQRLQSSLIMGGRTEGRTDGWTDGWTEAREKNNIRNINTTIKATVMTVSIQTDNGQSLL